MRFPFRTYLQSGLLILASLWPVAAAAQTSGTLPDAPEAQSEATPPSAPSGETAGEDGSSVAPPPQSTVVPVPEESRAGVAADPGTSSAPPSEATPPAESASSTRFAELHGETRAKEDYRTYSDDQLRDAYKKNSKGGPTAMAVTGGVLLSGAGPLFLLGAIAGISCAANSLPCYGIGTFIAVTGGISAVGTGMLIGGVIWVDHRKDNRQAITNEMARRESEGASPRQLRLGVSPTLGGATLGLDGTF